MKTITTSSSDRSAALAAAVILVVGMGIGRFAFTGLYPQMVQDNVMTVSVGSYAASANNAGYLIGAFLAGFFPSVSSLRKCIFAIVATVICTLTLALPVSHEVIIGIRAFAGIASAFAMVSASHWLLHDQANTAGAPLLYSGVGLGIAISAELIAAGSWYGLNSELNWLLVSVAGAAMGICALQIMSTKSHVSSVQTHITRPGHTQQAALSARTLLVIYMLSGFGASITSAYLPLFVRGALGSFNPVHVWTLFGIGAIPSSFLWHLLHERLGTKKALTTNLLVQGIGVGLPAVYPSVMSYGISAILVGGSFMGTVTIVLPAARRVAHTVKFNVLAMMSSGYGVGAIVGPLIADAVFARQQSFTLSLYFAAVALLIAAAAATFSRKNGTTETKLTT
ncbi:YbfB/YjiJ family MFS transporter [Oxalicibacterium faecigallinarum]|uniref:Sugar transporter n=1 Tax=Oxalicibacterium faecigallinarum TaxID=573741 RepID=A0A8J3ATU6_9BURK|nr:YbfB/YjiJ family MFS transporter [Oxalicibacterium faecigallinarum]GGI20460.1 sugar transporter [Oxalicibacterium faecigallinarum]